MINDLPHTNQNVHKSPSETVYGDRQQQMCILFSMWEDMKKEGLEHFIESLEPDKTTRQ